MMKLLVLPKAFGELPASNFSIKAMALLAMSGLDHTIENANPNKGPKGKMPVLEDGDTIVPDSSHIQNYLERRYGIEFDADLTGRELADSEAYRRMVEEHLYWAVLHVRYFLYPHVTRDAIFGSVPFPLRQVVFAMIRRQVVKALHAQGMGRHSPEQVQDFAIGNLQALADRIGDGPYFFGPSPTSIDASVYPILQSIMAPPMDCRMRQFLLAEPRLSNYAARCERAFFGPDPFRAKRAAVADPL